MYRTIVALFHLTVPLFAAVGLFLLFIGFGGAIFVRPFSLVTAVRFFVGLGGLGFLMFAWKIFRVGNKYLDSFDYIAVAFGSCITAVVLTGWLYLRFPEAGPNALVAIATPSMLWAGYFILMLPGKRRREKVETS